MRDSRLRWERRSLRGSDEMELRGPIWPCSASFTPNGEAGNEATVASLGPPLTRTRWASRPWLWPWLASSGVARSGETFNSVSFSRISSHSYRLRGTGGPGTRGCRLRGNDETPHTRPNPHTRPLPEGQEISDACNQCKGWGGGGTMGSCRRVGTGTESERRRSRRAVSRVFIMSWTGPCLTRCVSAPSVAVSG